MKIFPPLLIKIANALLSQKVVALVLLIALCSIPAYGFAKSTDPQKKAEPVGQVLEGGIYETDLGSESVFQRAWQGGLVVFSVLLTLVIFSILSWAIFIAKFIYLNKISTTSDNFIKSFWESRSLNDLNSKLSEHPYSPVKEVFRTGYAELVRGSQLKEQTQSIQLAINAAIENITRSLRKARSYERKRLERYLTLLATIASSSPFIGLFGTVWGIMGAFEGIARTGSASLAAVAPGISEALIATAFGLAAAIPALIGYNVSNAKIRKLSAFMEGFSSDFINIIERYLITDRGKSQASSMEQNPL